MSQGLVNIHMSIMMRVIQIKLWITWSSKALWLVDALPAGSSQVCCRGNNLKRQGYWVAQRWKYNKTGFYGATPSEVMLKYVPLPVATNPLRPTTDIWTWTWTWSSSLLLKFQDINFKFDLQSKHYIQDPSKGRFRLITTQVGIFRSL